MMEEIRVGGNLTKATCERIDFPELERESAVRQQLKTQLEARGGFFVSLAKIQKEILHATQYLHAYSI